MHRDQHPFLDHSIKMENLQMVPYAGHRLEKKQSQTRLRGERVGSALHDSCIHFLLQLTSKKHLVDAVHDLGICEWTRAMPTAEEMTKPQLLTLIRRYQQTSPSLIFLPLEIIHGIISRHKESPCLHAVTCGQMFIEAKCIGGYITNMFARYRDLRFPQKMNAVKRQASVCTLDNKNVNRCKRFCSFKNIRLFRFCAAYLFCFRYKGITPNRKSFCPAPLSSSAITPHPLLSLTPLSILRSPLLPALALLFPKTENG